MHFLQIIDGYKGEVVSAFIYAATSMMKQFATDNFSSYNLGKGKRTSVATEYFG
jgi:hypothetical protein